MTSTVTKTILSVALGAAIFAGAGAAYAADNTPILYTHPNAYQPGPTYEGTVARHQSDRKVVLASHPNAYTKGPTRAGTVARYADRGTVFAGHPNTYHVARGKLFFNKGVTVDVANK